MSAPSVLPLWRQREAEAMRRLLLLAICVILASTGALAIGNDPQNKSSSPTLAVAGALTASVPDTTPFEDPFPIYRVRARESQIAKVLKQADQGPLVQLRRSEFEARVRSAGRIVAEARTVPHITHTHYSAVLIGGDPTGTNAGELVGTAELDLVNTSSVPQFLALDPLRLALTSATWADGREAVVGVPSGGVTTSVWVDRPGQQTLKFGWSATGITEFGERRFELRVPPALSTVLDLELPVGLRPTVSADVLLTGPFPVKGDTLRSSWRFRFGGRPRLDFAVRSAGNTGVSAYSNLATRYDITPAQLTCTFEFDLRPAKGTVSEWSFMVDPELRVTDVIVNNRESWSIDAPTNPGGPRRLRISLNQPGAGGKVLISGLAAFHNPSGPTDSPLPMIRPISTVLDEETMEIRLSPELKPAKWMAGDYRLTDSQVLPDQTRTISLYGTLLPPGADRIFRQPPTITTSTAEPELATTEQIAWRFDTDRISAQLRLGIRVRRSPLFQLTLRTPPGYSFLRAISLQDDLIASTGFSAGKVNVEFTRPLMPGQTADLVFEFVGPRAEPSRFAFPIFTPVGATERVGVLGIIPGPLWALDAKPGVGTTATGWLDLSALRPPTDTSVAFRYRGNDPDGWVTLTHVQPVFTAEVDSHIESRGNGKIAKSTLTLRLRSGGFSSILINEQDPAFAQRTWRVAGGINAVASAIPIPLTDFVRQFGLLAPSWIGRVGALCSSKSSHQGYLWSIQFAHPVTDEVILETTAPLPPIKGQFSGTASLFPLRVLGALESHLVSDQTPTRPNRETPGKEWLFSDVHIITAVRSEDDAEAVFGGTVVAAASEKLPIHLPTGAEILTVRVEAQLLGRGIQQLSPEGLLQVPLPANGPTRFEIRYRLPIESGFPAQIQSPDPKLPGDITEIHRWWAFGGNILPGWPIRAWEHTKTTDLPTLLGSFPVTGTNVLISSTAVDKVRVSSIQAAKVVGIALALGLFLVGWLGSRRRPFYSLLTMSILFAVGAASLLGPPWWQRAAIVPVTIGLLTAAGIVLVRSHRALGVAGVGIATVFAMSPSTTPAQPTTPAVVVILPQDADGRENVVAPKAVLDRLAAITRSTPPGAIITAADYTLAVDDTTARVTAKLIAHAFGDTDATATIPLSDARLERVTVDGMQAPVSQRPGVYTVPLPASGRHEIQIRFSIPLAGTGTEREFHFGVPECPTTRVVADFPTSARQIQLVGRVGKQSIVDGVQKHIEVDAGNIKTLQFRWREGGGGTALFKVREACIWDVSEKGAELTACYLTRIEQGTISILRFDLPGELEPIDVSLRPLDSSSAAALRDWSLGTEREDGSRQLRLDLQGPTAGRMLTCLSCRLKKAVTRQPLLRFPKPVLAGSIAEQDTTYALRTKELVNKVTIDGLGRIGMIDYDPGALIRDKEWTKISELRLDTNTPIKVFQPTPGVIHELRPTLRSTLDRFTANLETSWQVAPHRAEANGTIQWNEKEPLPLIEFTVPGVRVLELRGTEVATWTQSAERVCVWFRKPVNEGELEWIGTMTPIPNGQQPPNPLPWEAVTPRVINAKLALEVVHIHPSEGWQAQVELARGWTATSQRGDDLGFQTTAAAVMPIRVILTPAVRLAPTNGFGWLSPSPRPRAVIEPSVTPPTRNESVASSTSGTSQIEPSAAASPPWVLPVSTTIVWCVSIIILAFFLTKFPYTTWPEQLGLVTGLFGMMIVGHWWFGLIGWTLARIAWLMELAVRSPRLSSQSSTK